MATPMTHTAVLVLKNKSNFFTVLDEALPLGPPLLCFLVSILLAFLLGNHCVLVGEDEVCTTRRYNELQGCKKSFARLSR